MLQCITHEVELKCVKGARPFYGLNLVLRYKVTPQFYE